MGGTAVTELGAGVFSEAGILSLRGMEAVKMLEEGCFADCNKLESLVGMGPGVTELPHACFYKCKRLKSRLGLSPNVTKFGSVAFFNSASITDINGWPLNVETIKTVPFGHAFTGRTCLLPPELADRDADPAAVIMFLNAKAREGRYHAACA